MKKRLMYLFLITASLIAGSCRNQTNENQTNENQTNGADKQEVSESNPYDGLYDWYVNYQDMTGQMYREELGCEIKNGRVVEATWYSYPKSSPMTGTLNGNMLELSGNNSVYTSLWMKFTIDLRNGRGTVSNNLIPPTEAKFHNNN
ncbi:MAG: hypothetical protein J6Y79_01255 [Paludibacteraceae bacterium]|nr:hypothetical protein [Paludibacteraceae bacterium]